MFAAALVAADVEGAVSDTFDALKAQLQANLTHQQAHTYEEALYWLHQWRLLARLVLAEWEKERKARA